MLEIKDLRVEYNGAPALHGLSVEVGTNDHVALVGPNGAGKTALLKAISGVEPAVRGSIVFEGVDITNLRPDKRVEMGIVHVPEGRQVFTGMTVAENLELGAYRKDARPRLRERLELVETLFPILLDMRHSLAASLSGGQQQMLAIGRGLVACPRLLLLDEPSMGLSPVAADEVFSGLARLREIEESSMLLVEQRAHEAFEQCDRAYVVESGDVQMSGTTSDLLKDTALVQAYIGGDM